MPAAKTLAQITFPTKIDVPESDRQTLIQLLNERLADTSDLYSQVKQAHWNVKGSDFFQLHELFDQLAEELFPFVDALAERATQLGGVAMGTTRMAASASSLPEYPADVADGAKHLKLLIDRYAQYTAAIRKGIDTSDDHNDKTTADLFTEISRAVDKHLWFLEAHVQH
jgi:starvation-inducible DNA-binding protein